MQVWNALHAARCKYRTQKSPFCHHHTSLSGYFFATEAHADNRKNFLNSNVSPTYPHNELQPTSGWDMLAILGHSCKFQRVSRLGSVTARHSSSMRLPNFAALNRGRHLYSAGRPSRWALAHILALCYFTELVFDVVVKQLSRFQNLLLVVYQR